MAVWKKKIPSVEKYEENMLNIRPSPEINRKYTTIRPLHKFVDNVVISFFLLYFLLYPLSSDYCTNKNNI